MPLILNGLPPMHWAVAGALIAATTLTLLVVANRRLGISSGLEDICSLVLRQPYFQRGAVLNGRPWRMRTMKPGFNASALACINPTPVSMPAACNAATPLPATNGLGSFMAETTRRTPAATKPSVHGGVRP